MKKTVLLMAALLSVCLMFGPVRAGAEAVERVHEHSREEPKGVLMLTVSEITLTFVGDSENIYMGTIPVENVEWSSDDPSIISVENGVITAVSVGTTQIHATCGSRSVSCIAGCLTEDAETFKKLPLETRRSLMRKPPIVECDPTSFFDDVGIIGDSITYGMMCHEVKEGMLGTPQFLCRGGVSIMGFVVHAKEVAFQGREYPIEEVVQRSGVQKIVIQLGQNDLRFRSVENALNDYKTVIERMREKVPELQIYIETAFPECTPFNEENFHNEKIEEFNDLLWAFAEENDCRIWNVYPYSVDHMHRMPDAFSLDGAIHLNHDGCIAWRQALLAYACLELTQMEVA